MNTIRRSLVGLALLSTAILSASAQPPAAAPAPVATDAAPDITIVATPSYVSAYMFRGTQIGGQSLQPSVTYTYGSLSLEVWNNDPILKSGHLPGEPGAEIDPQGTYTISVSDSLSIQPGFTWYNYSRPVDGDGLYRTTFEPNLGIGYTVFDTTITPKAYYDVVLHGPTYEVNATHSIPLKAIDTEIDLLGTLGSYEQTNVVNHSTPATKAWGNYWLLGATIPLQFNKHQQLSIGWAYTEGTDGYTKQAAVPKQTNASSVGRGVTTVSYAWTF